MTIQLLYSRRKAHNIVYKSSCIKQSFLYLTIFHLHFKISYQNKGKKYSIHRYYKNEEGCSLLITTKTRHKFLLLSPPQFADILQIFQLLGLERHPIKLLKLCRKSIGFRFFRTKHAHIL